MMMNFEQYVKVDEVVERVVRRVVGVVDEDTRRCITL